MVRCVSCCTAATIFSLGIAFAAQAAEPYEIGVLIPMTGPGAFLGQAQAKTLSLAEHAVNTMGGIAGRPIKFVGRDDQTNPQVDVQLAGDLIAGKPAIIAGGGLTAGCRAVAALVKNGPVYFCFSPGIHPDAGSYVFTATVSTHDLIAADIRYFRLRGWSRIAVLVSNDASGQDAEQGIKDALALPENKDVTLATVAHFSTGDVTVAAQIETIKAAKPQVLVAWTTGTPVATVFRGIIEAGLDLPILTTDGNMTHAQMDQYASFLPRDLYVASSEWVARDATFLAPEVAARHAEFYRALDAAGIAADLPTTISWDPALLIAEALRTLGPAATAPQILEHLLHLKGFAGINGIYDFTRVPQRGIDIEDAVVTRWSKHAKTWQVVSQPGGVPLP